MSPEDVQFIEQRIFPKIKVNPLTGCWIWQGSLSTNKYGYLQIATKRKQVHRLMYDLYKGPIPEGTLVCHSCDIPACCNPEHLWAGTQTDNMRDASRKGRVKNQNTNKTHCRYGHEFTPDNTYVGQDGFRVCKACAHVKYLKQRAKGNR